MTSSSWHRASPGPGPGPWTTNINRERVEYKEDVAIFNDTKTAKMCDSENV